MDKRLTQNKAFPSHCGCRGTRRTHTEMCAVASHVEYDVFETNRQEFRSSTHNRNEYHLIRNSHVTPVHQPLLVTVSLSKQRTAMKSQDRSFDDRGWETRLSLPELIYLTTKYELTTGKSTTTERNQSQFGVHPRISKNLAVIGV
jgi:hypothetical protein